MIYIYTELYSLEIDSVENTFIFMVRQRIIIFRLTASSGHIDFILLHGPQTGQVIHPVRLRTGQ